MKKRMVCIVLALVMTLTPIFTLATAASNSGATVTANAVLSGDGKKLTVTFMLQSSVEAFAVDLEIEYNMSLLSVSSTEDEIIDSSEFPNGNGRDAILNYYGQQNVIKFISLDIRKGIYSCRICEIEFNVLGSVNEQNPGFLLKHSLLDETVIKIETEFNINFMIQPEFSEIVAAKTNLASVGNDMTIDLMLNSSIPAYGATINVVYDSSKLRLVSSEDEVINSSGFPHNNGIDVNLSYLSGSVVRFLALDINKGTTSCRVLKITFKVISPITQEDQGFYAEIESLLDENAKNIESGTRAKIEFVRTGDVSNDEFIRLDDAMLTFQQVAGKINLDGLEYSSADVNGDGEVKLDDAMRIFQYVAGKITEF